MRSQVRDIQWANVEAIDNSDWNALESTGCVFLPVTRYRNNSTVTGNGWGYYWSTTHSETTNADALVFQNNLTVGSRDRYLGMSVRLVQDAE